MVAATIGAKFASSNTLNKKGQKHKEMYLVKGKIDDDRVHFGQENDGGILLDQDTEYLILSFRTVK